MLMIVNFFAFGATKHVNIKYVEVCICELAAVVGVCLRDVSVKSMDCKE